MALPPSFGNTPFNNVNNKTQYMPNGLPALKPKGINVETLFSENIKDNEKRFNRVEGVVKDLRQEFESYKPSIVRLAAVESDIQNLIKELEVLLQETPSQQPTATQNQIQQADLQVQQLAPQPLLPDDIKSSEAAGLPDTVNKPPKTKHKQYKPPPKAKSYDGVVAQNLRVGEHADKVRLVLDTNHKTNFRVDLDNDEKLIIVEMPDARWVGTKEKTFKHSALLESYSVESFNNGKGSLLVLSLRKSTSIMTEKRLSPDSTSPYHRIYFDLKP